MFMEGMTLIMLVMNDAIVVHLDLHVKWYRNFCGLVLKGWCIFNGQVKDGCVNSGLGTNFCQLDFDKNTMP